MGSRVSYHFQAVDGFRWPQLPLYQAHVTPRHSQIRTPNGAAGGERSAAPVQWTPADTRLPCSFEPAPSGRPRLFNFLRMKCPHNGPSPLLISPLLQLFHCLPWIARTHRSSHPVAPNRLLALPSRPLARPSRLLALPNNGRRARRPQICCREITGMKPQYV